MKCIGNTVIGPNGRVESRSLGVEELAYVLDVLLVANKVKQGSWGFPDLVTMLDSVTKVNPHQHITGSIGDPDLLRRVIQVYRQDQSARSAFLEYVLQSFIVREDEIPGFFEQSDDALVPWFQRKVPLAGDPWDFDEADDRLSLTRLAFQSQSPDSWELLQEAYRTVALENAAHGVEEVWFRTSLGDHQKDSFVRAAGAALRGAQSAVAQAEFPLRVRYMVGLRKLSPDAGDGAGNFAEIDLRAEGLAAAINQLRGANPEAREMLLGIDSVGMDSSWLPRWQASARRIAGQAQLRVAVHFGESWQEGELLTRLKILLELVELGDIHQLDNANALFAVKDLASSEQQYSNGEWAEIRRVQRQVFETLADRGIGLGINPTSNELLTRSLRDREGWRFRTLEEPMGVGMLSAVDLMGGILSDSKPLALVVGNDNSRIYSSRVSGGLLTVSEELANLWKAHGSTKPSVYGKVSTEIIALIITNGFAISSIGAFHLSSSEHSTGERDFPEL
jgi:hypothetical protein